MTLKKSAKIGGNKARPGKNSTLNCQPDNLSRGSVKMGLMLALVIIAVVLAFAAAAYYLYPQLAGIKKPAAEKNAATSTPVTITYISNQPLVDPTDAAIINLDNIIADFTKQTGIKVNRIKPPQAVENYSDISIYLRDILRSDQSKFDVTMVDGPWTGMFAPYMLELTPYFKNRLTEFFPELIANGMVDGKLIAIPYFQDMTVLFYRTDLLKKYGYANPPQTWDELEQMAKVIQTGERKIHDNFWGYVWAADESESLTCTALGLQASYGGGTIIDNGVITVDNPRTAQALEKAIGWIGTISPPNILKSTEDDIIMAWDIGNAAFMQNWPDSYQISEESIINGEYQITALPSGGFKHSGVYGGEYLGIDKRTAHPREAAMFLQYMTSPEVQKKRAMEDVWSPVLLALYSDPDLAKAQPVYNYISSAIFAQGVERPGSQIKNIYDSVASAYFTNIHAILAKKVSIKNGLKELETELINLTGLPASND
ncbi:MAG: extracellular solute-binding protein [Patescibacteria group bacterium]|nr:extracellular solute-binding protein [Patescibacteria group bacterium]